jgi:hypothetical protein
VVLRRRAIDAGLNLNRAMAWAIGPIGPRRHSPGGIRRTRKDPPKARKGAQMAEVEASTHEALAGKLETLEGALGLREEYRAATGLDERTFALVKIAALIALDARPRPTRGRSPVRSRSGSAPRTSSGFSARWPRRWAALGSSRRRPRSCSPWGYRCPRTLRSEPAMPLMRRRPRGLASSGFAGSARRCPSRGVRRPG